MNQMMKRIVFSATAMLILLTACAPQTQATQDPALIQQLIEQSVALTVAAQNAETATAAALATDTPLPTQTEPPTPTPLLPTATPFVIVPPTLAPGGGGGGTIIKPEYACEAIRRKPADNTVFHKNAHFDVKWTIVNTGTKTIRAGTDFEYFSGPQMTITTFVELPELRPGEQKTYEFDAVAPNKRGKHVMTWRVEGPMCFPYIAIIVE